VVKCTKRVRDENRKADRTKADLGEGRRGEEQATRLAVLFDNGN
jgi:hypothetical protein